MEWERDGRGWRLDDAEDYYEIIPCKLHKMDRFTVWKNGVIWLATTETFHAADIKTVTEMRSPEFYSAKLGNAAANLERQAWRNAQTIELKRREVNEAAKRTKTVKLYRW